MTGDQLVRIWLRTRRRCAGATDDRGSIALLLLVILVGLSLGGLLVPMIITQDRATRFETTRGQALDAAQAGLDVMLGNLRRATNGDVDPVGGSGQGTKGDASKLPCPTAPMTGNVNGGPAMYSVTVAYFSTDPFQANPTPFNPCGSGGMNATVVPGYAQLTSTGTVPPAVNGATKGRTLMSTYQFRTTDTVGGVISTSMALAGGTPLCMDAGAPNPTNGTLVTMATCTTSSPPSAKQVFAYRKDLTIQLASSINAATPYGLCLTPAPAGMVSLSTCQAAGLPTPPPYNQQWSLNPYGAYQSTVPTSRIDGVLGNQCLQVLGQQLTIAACSNNAADSTQAWTNSLGVGLGAAVLPQWTNYADFGRCIYAPSATDRMWSYPCTQDPWAGAVPKAQSFIWSPVPAVAPGSPVPPGASGPITSANGTCLTAPTAAGAVVAATCNGGQPQTWTVNSGSASSYSARYTITNGSLCLGLSDKPLTGDRWLALQTETCTGAADQKWNVPPNALTLTLQNIEK